MEMYNHQHVHDLYHLDLVQRWKGSCINNTFNIKAARKVTFKVQKKGQYDKDRERGTSVSACKRQGRKRWPGWDLIVDQGKDVQAQETAQAKAQRQDLLTPQSWRALFMEFEPWSTGTGDTWRTELKDVMIRSEFRNRWHKTDFKEREKRMGGHIRDDAGQD